MSNIVNIYDRIKQLSFTTSTNNIELANSVNGFDDFRSVYAHNDIVLYAITDGLDYEVGSGVFKNKDHNSIDEYNYDTIIRYPIKSSNNNNKVSFGPGAKEVFCTYPATHAVYIGSGLGLRTPAKNGVAFWDSANVLNYSSDFYWDDNNSLLGIKNRLPSFAVDIGGTGDASSCVRASGYYVGSTGVYFSPRDTYTGGTQIYHFERNQLNQSTGSNLIFELSGIVNQNILLKKQAGNTIFAGPTVSCQGCPSEYPSFRALVAADIPNLSSTYSTVSLLNSTSGNLRTVINGLGSSLSGNFTTFQNQVNSGVATTLATYQNNFNSQITAQSGLIDNFIATSSGRIDNVVGTFSTEFCSVVGSGANLYSSGPINQASYTTFPFAYVETEARSGNWDLTNSRYNVTKSGVYLVTANMALRNIGASFGTPKYRVCKTSGGNTTNYLEVDMSFPSGTYHSSKSWMVPSNSGDFIFLQYQGYFFNGSSMTIHRI
jgi:hypothetical protein